MLSRKERKKKKIEKLRKRALKHLDKARDKGKTNFPHEYARHDPDLRSLRRNEKDL